MRAYWLRLNWWFGKLANLAGWPSIIRESDYRSDAICVSVKVRKSPLYTIVTVNGIDVYFYRFTGGIDGVGISLPTDCRLDSVDESARPVVASAPPRCIPRTGILPARDE